MVIYSLSIVIIYLILLYGYSHESVRPSVRHNSVNLMWHTDHQWSPPSNNFWTNPTPDRAQRYYVMYASTWTAHWKGANRFDNCSLYTCVRQARRSDETSAAGVRTHDISATRRLRIRVLQALFDALPQPPAVQAVVSDFEAALWSAVRDVSPGVAQRGREFHFSQAVWRNVQSVGLQLAYVRQGRR